MIDLAKLTDYEILLLTMIGESRGEVVEGQIAVGSVIMNRARRYKDTIDNVCLRPNQFSCWNQNDPNRPILMELAEQLYLAQKLDIAYNQIIYLTQGIINGKIYDNTKGCLHYLTSSLFNSKNRPDWAKNVIFAITKGNQTFFNIAGESL